MLGIFLQKPLHTLPRLDASAYVRSFGRIMLGAVPSIHRCTARGEKSPASLSSPPSAPLPHASLLFLISLPRASSSLLPLRFLSLSLSSRSSLPSTACHLPLEEASHRSLLSSVRIPLPLFLAPPSLFLVSLPRVSLSLFLPLCFLSLPLSSRSSLLPTACHLPSGGSFSSKLVVVRPSPLATTASLLPSVSHAYDSGPAPTTPGQRRRLQHYQVI